MVAMAQGSIFKWQKISENILEESREILGFGESLVTKSPGEKDTVFRIRLSLMDSY